MSYELKSCVSISIQTWSESYGTAEESVFEMHRNYSMIYIKTTHNIFCVTINSPVEFHACHIPQGTLCNAQSPAWLIKISPGKELREIWLKMSFYFT